MSFGVYACQKIFSGFCLGIAAASMPTAIIEISVLSVCKAKAVKNWHDLLICKTICKFCIKHE